MSPIAGMTPTGRSRVGPASDLVEVQDEDGVVHTAIVFHEQWRDHSAITDALGVILGFLESPLVTGLVELVGHSPEEGAFLYPTGQVRSVSDLVRALSDCGQVGGVRAGLELMYTAGQILTEGAEAGEPQGVYSHGGLTPRRIVIKEDGQVMILGYGLPQVEILQFHEDSAQVPREDSFRYCPPERIDARPENLSSDLFGLALIAFELMTGKPVYDGLVNDIRQQAARGEGSRRLFRFREVLPDGVRDLLIKVLRPDLDARYESGEDFLSDVHTLLSDRSVPGSSLLGLMEYLQSNNRRTGAALQQGSTQMVGADELREQLRESGGRAVAEPVSVDAERPDSGDFEEPAPPTPSNTASPDSAESTGDESPKRWSKVRRQARRVRRTETAEDLAPPVVAPVEAASVEPDPASPESVPAAAATPPLTPESPESVAPPPEVPAPPRVPRRPVRRARPSAAVEASPPTAIEANPPTADDLLLQIRGGRGGTDPVVRKISDERTAMFKRDEVMEVVVEDSDKDDFATVMMTPAQLREKLAANLDESNEHQPEPTSKGVLPPGPANVDRVGVQIMCTRGLRHTFGVNPDAKVADAILAMVGDVVALPFDQMGGLQGWYRLEREGQRIDAMHGAVELTGRPTQLVWIESGSRVVEVCVRTGGKEVRFSNPMSIAVPARSLVRFLAGWLSLPDGDWVMAIDGQDLLDGSILADFSGAGTLAVELRLRDS